MVKVQKKKILAHWVLILFSLIIAGIILGISLVRTSLNTVLKEENENELRTEPVESSMPSTNGSMEKFSYKLPSANILPGNFFYIFKKIRENLWIRFTKTTIDKSKISLLIADKRVSESIILIKYSKIDKAFETIQEAIDKLKYSREILKGYKGDKIEIDQLKEQIFKAGFAYKQILDDNKQSFEKTQTENEKYKKMVKEIDFWNQIQTKERNAEKK